MLDDSKNESSDKEYTDVKNVCKDFEWKYFMKHEGKRKSSISKLSWFINVILNLYVHLN